MVLTADAKERLDRFLAKSLPEHSRSKLVRVISDGGLTVDGKVITKSSFQVEPGMSIQLEEVANSSAHTLVPSDIPIHVVYEDDSLLVVDKPRGLVVHPAPGLNEPTLVEALLGRGTKLSEGSAAFRPGIVHRLDKETTGLLVVAKTDAAHANLAAQIEAKTAGREYLAVVKGEIEREKFTIDAPLGPDPRDRTKRAVVSNGKVAITHLRRLGRADGGTILEARLETGRTHQIRVHLMAIGHPVLGDSIYAPVETQVGPLQLHAYRLAFEHPLTGERVSFETDPPADFNSAWRNG
ncbi:RluA family pseudouridine synthase [bacterium]|nr:MAG: RluA family pseudouridine synthase [bacterium]